MLLLDSEDGLGGTVYRVDLGTGATTPLATSDGTDPTKMRIATGITTTRCFPFGCAVSPPVVPPPPAPPRPRPRPRRREARRRPRSRFGSMTKLKLGAKGIAIPFKCAIACRLKVGGKLSGLGGKSVALTAVTANLPAGRSVTVVLKLKSGAALARHEGAEAPQAAEGQPERSRERVRRGDPAARPDVDADALSYAAKRCALRARAFAASASRSFAGADVTSRSSSSDVAAAIAATA